ncbi:MAG: rod shape-determining protein RodA [Candidatus Omnitrophota bacterium]
MNIRPQKILFVVLLLLLSAGLVCLFSSCHQEGIFIKKDIFQKQLLWLGVGLCAMVLAARSDYKKLRLFAWPLYGVVLATLGFVLVAGRIIMGAQRWISLGEFSFQPSELGKFVLILLLAQYFSQKNITDVRFSARPLSFVGGLLWPLGIMMIPAGLVLLQPDLGTAVVYIFLFLSVAFMAGVPLRYLLGLVFFGLSCFPIFWHFLKDYQKSRLLVFLNPNSDPLGAGYTVIQSQIAIGSGRWFGRGWMAGTQSQLNFLAERHTDFIFSVWGEEWGFLGSIVLLFLYGVLIVSILRIADRAQDAYGKLLCVGFAALIFFHVLVNIAMNIGMCPVVGLPLPFVSYGGSSLLINLLGVGIVLSVARQR